MKILRNKTSPSITFQIENSLQEIDKAKSLGYAKYYNAKQQGKKNPTMENYFSLRSTPRDQFSIKSVLASKEAIQRAYMTTARFFYDACILTNFVNSFWFKSMMDAILQTLNFVPLAHVFKFVFSASKQFPGGPWLLVRLTLF